tara:strand:- start:5806 stop:5988 length:183 start_codon:yes stop_codon:yes gene_type:complete
MKYRRITIDGMPTKPKFIAEEYVRTRGSAMRRRDRAISDTLKQVHKPWHSRPTKDTLQDT